MPQARASSLVEGHMGAAIGNHFAFSAEEFLELAQGPTGKPLQTKGKLSHTVTRFLRGVQEGAVADDLDELQAPDILAMATGLWEFGTIRKPGETLVRIVRGKHANGSDTGRDLLEIITGDKPFLVDSVMGELARNGIQSQAMFHPVIDLGRADDGPRDDTAPAIRESLIQVHMPRLDNRMKKTLLKELKATLEDVSAAVSDWMAMRDEMNRAIEELFHAPSSAPEEEVAECIEFLRWIRDEHFAFLGSRQYVFPTDDDGQLLPEEPEPVAGTSNGILRNPDTVVLRRGSEPTLLAKEAQEFLNQPTPLIVAKSNLRSRVHRQVYMDYIGVKRWNDDGKVIGETRFVGLFTAEAYDRMARDVPLIRRKVRRVLVRAQSGPGSHNAKKLQNIVENYPRDELFQITEEQLLEFSKGILHLHERPRPKLFVRRDQFDRFASIFVFCPRERYNTDMRERIGEMLRKAYGGRLSAYYPHFGEGPLARVHFIIGLDPHNHPEPDLDDLEHQIVEMARSWHDRVVARALEAEVPTPVLDRLPVYRGAFTAGYREDFTARQAVKDISKMEQLSAENDLVVHVYRLTSDAPDMLRLKLYRQDEAMPLSGIMPMLEEMGLDVHSEASFPIRRKREPIVWVHSFETTWKAGRELDMTKVRKPLEEALAAIYNGYSENDGFNRLILSLGVSWRSVAFLRTCARFRQQSGLDPSQFVQEEALSENPALASLLLDLAHCRFAPNAHKTLAARKKAEAKLVEQIIADLEAVPSLDHDRVLRRMMRLICAIQRTSFFQTDPNGKPLPRISIKIASRELGTLPAPKPYREIFVWSPRVEGVHLRFGPVARGGLRWSDRRDDFRTEVLGLVKAQQVKNSVIVPVGSKGGFFPKQLPRPEDRDAWMAEGIASYKTFVSGLLDITDTLDAQGDVIHPQDVVVWDGEDPYLVVAADKGTATFSDIANGVAEDYGFWLGDAFASGGSVGYDHKKMGITAKGAWEAVKRHFREMGKNTQEDPFTVIGVGDMSGDVFGNGMLLSKQIRLLAAFDHRDIFIDPDPGDSETNWAERKRLFDLPRSSWQDYDQSLISEGGGVFSRNAKAIPLSKEMRALTGLRGKDCSPNELMHALLQAEAELLWFGGIGTYVKSHEEQNWEVGDKANDAIRVNADQVGAKVIGEGANLGITHKGRIEFAKLGGRVNADFVDNSAGVDTSDHEVNLKILLNAAVQSGKIDAPARNKLLARMTNDVAASVLEHNYEQTLTLSMAEATNVRDMNAYGRFMDYLEGQDRLDREVENLPDADEVMRREENREGMTRPEMATIMAYAKNTLVEDLIAGTAPDDPHFCTMLRDYFPERVHDFKDERLSHRLHREIIAKGLANAMIDRGGPTFPFRLMGSAGVDMTAAALCFEAARELFGFDDLVHAINALDNQIPWPAQRALHMETMRVTRRMAYWLARRPQLMKAGLTSVIEACRPGVVELRANLENIVSSFEQDSAEKRKQWLMEQGAPEKLAKQVAWLRPMISATDIIDLSAEERWPLMAVARIYHGVGSRFHFDHLRASAGSLEAENHWDRLAVRRIIEDLYHAQRGMAAACMAHVLLAGGKLMEGRDKARRDWVDNVLDGFVDVNNALVERAIANLDDLDQGQWTLSKLAIANTQMRELSTSVVS